MQRYAITDRSLLSPEHWEAALTDQVGRWASVGVEWVQLREKDLPALKIASLARTLAKRLRHADSPTRLLVNGLSPERARQCGAHGVHLPGGSEFVQIEAAAREGAVSVSCHTLDEARIAREAGATLLLWAPVFSKVVAGREVAPGTGLAQLHVACALAAPVPVFALGGVTRENASLCLQAGADGVAGIRLFEEA